MKHACSMRSLWGIAVFLPFMISVGPSFVVAAEQSDTRVPQERGLLLAMAGGTHWADYSEQQRLVEKAQATLAAVAADQKLSTVVRSMTSDVKALFIVPTFQADSAAAGEASGNGVLLVRDAKTAVWNGPAFYTIVSSTLRPLNGGPVSDVVLLITTQKDLDAFARNAAKLGGDIAMVAGSVVFSPPAHPVKLHDHFQWWSYVKGANWRHPEGPQSSIKDRGRYPVVHIAYEDALAYAKWAGKRMPTEAEFEFATRGGLERKPYTWGDELKPGGKFMANTFQGHFPDKNTTEDGYGGAAPVSSFPPNGYGLYDMVGNVWEWTSDWYRHDYYQTLATQGPLARNPQGPVESLDPSEPGVKKKVHKGGSYLCTDQYCARYIAGGRGKGEPETGTNHLGFRLVRDSNGTKS